MAKPRSSIPWTSDARHTKAGATVGSRIAHFGPDAPETQAARTEVRVVRAELALEDLINSAPAPTAEQVERIRRLLPAVGITPAGVAA
ncbi:hypothetical protein [Micromonospora avicenniae]|uniref:Uncharacterized protein n=1 Tax=Micromonospora avicenniae TaxID=1198245 RepID=A0A1N6YEC9_9ACTN|nr:hypothetical protein [Micromonospora avicenniae]SIR12903.1 hypothetical protein SAMN05444858_106273 [Micromonospora avicenniae]